MSLLISKSVLRSVLAPERTSFPRKTPHTYMLTDYHKQSRLRNALTPPHSSQPSKQTTSVQVYSRKARPSATSVVLPQTIYSFLLLTAFLNPLAVESCTRCLTPLKAW